MTSHKEEIYIYGKHPVLAALESGRSKEVIVEVFLTKEKAEDVSLVSTLQKASFLPKKVTEEEIESKVGRGAVHQGVCALINVSSLYISLEEFLASKKEGNPCLVLLDELEDPHNVGAIIRSCVAFGADGVLIPEHGQVQVNGTVAKTSVGTLFSIPLIKIGNVNTTLRTLKDKGYWTYALVGGGDTSLHKVVFDTPSVIIVGSEGKGVREKTEAISDFRLSIPISPLCESLNASNAVAVTLYEWAKQQPPHN